VNDLTHLIKERDNSGESVPKGAKMYSVASPYSPSRSAWRLTPALAILLAASNAFGQLPHDGPTNAIALAASLPNYDVSTVKQNIISGDSGYGTGFHPNNDSFSAFNVTLKYVIELAYGVEEDQIFGLSGPVSSARFDIKAKVVPPDGGPMPKLTRTQLAAMLIPLLADRFHLTMHLETKVLPVYELVVARGGPKFELSQDERTACDWGLGLTNFSNTLNAKSCFMAELATKLSDQVHRKVIDKTGLTGRAGSITLKWSNDVAAEHGGESNAPSIFTAVNEQLGLKLQPSKGPLDTVVIDHAEMPSAN